MDRIKFLEDTITKAQNAYYNGEDVTMSDAEFDALWDELMELDPKNPILHKVGKDSGSAFEKAEHIMHMNSQKKCTNAEEFREWARNHPGNYLVEYKCDGSSIELQYSNGKFVRAVTRGNGEIGDDVTENIKEIKFPKDLKDKSFNGAVRGEVLLSHETFNTHFKDKANCRNAANGIMKRKNSKEAKYLSIVVYDAARLVNGFKTETSKIQWLHDNGFDVVYTKSYSNENFDKVVEEIIQFRDQIAIDRFKDVWYDIDGLVIKCSEIHDGDDAKDRPDYQIAFKFSLMEQPTVVRAVDWSASGKTRTPVAITDPVYLCGTTVKRANICNVGLIRKMGLKIGSRVMMVKRGEIIPKIERVLESSGIDIAFPTVCEFCGSKLIVTDSQIYCPNKECSNTIIHRIVKWASVNKIYGIGESVARYLLENGIATIKDLYTASESKIISAVKSDKIGKKLKANINNAKNIPVAKFIAGYDLDEIGEITIKNICKALKPNTLEELLNISEGKLASCSGFSEISSENICNQFREYKTELLELANVVGVNMPVEFDNTFGGITDGKGYPWLGNQHVAFTGELVSMKRSAAEEMLERVGGIVDKKVTSKTRFVVANAPSNSSKYKDAIAKGINIINEEEFFHLLRGTF